MTSEVISSKDAFSSSGNYLSAKEGEETPAFTVKELRKVTLSGDELNYALSKTDYKYELVTTDDQILTVSSWALYKELKKIVDSGTPLEGLKLIVKHPARGVYEVVIVE